MIEQSDKDALEQIEKLIGTKVTPSDVIRLAHEYMDEEWRLAYDEETEAHPIMGKYWDYTHPTNTLREIEAARTNGEPIELFLPYHRPSEWVTPDKIMFGGYSAHIIHDDVVIDDCHPDSRWVWRFKDPQREEARYLAQRESELVVKTMRIGVTVYDESPDTQPDADTPPKKVEVFAEVWGDFAVYKIGTDEFYEVGYVWRGQPILPDKAKMDYETATKVARAFAIHEINVEKAQTDKKEQKRAKALISTCEHCHKVIGVRGEVVDDSLCNACRDIDPEERQRAKDEAYLRQRAELLDKEELALSKMTESERDARLKAQIL